MNDILERAETYRGHALYLGYGHYKAGKLAARKHLYLGAPVVIATAIVGTSIFATLSENPEIWLKILAGMVSLAATILAVLQTFFKFSELAEKHKLAGANYGMLRREIDLFLLRYGDKGPELRDEALNELMAIAESIGQLAKESPDLSDELYDEGVRYYSQQVRVAGENEEVQNAS